MSKEYIEYSKEVRAAVRSLWLGEIDVYEFVEFMMSSMETGFRHAWSEGAVEIDAEPNLNVENNDIIDSHMAAKSALLLGFAGVIVANSKKNGGKLTTLMKRAMLWAAAFYLVKEIAKTVVGEDVHLRWTLYPAEHCRSCVKLDGIVKTATEWHESDVYPRHWDKLDCRIGCKCSLEKTDAPVTESALPFLP